MSSARSVQRRVMTPSPHPKVIISMEEWDAKTSLSELETRSVNFIKTASEIVSLPMNFGTQEGDTSRPSTPGIRHKLAASSGSGSRPSTPVPSSSRLMITHALHPRQPVQTPQQFYDWFALVDRSVTHSQEAHFRAHVARVAAHLETCEELVRRIDEVGSEVDGMLDGWRGVEESGKSLKDACEKLLEERDRLLELTEDIGSTLEYFQELEHATRMLNHPGESLVLQTDFLYMVERVNICIDFLKANRHYKEAEIYLLRFQQCMTRAMTLIRMYFVGSLRALTADVLQRLAEKDVSETAQMHLLYTRFRSASTQLSSLLGELERRARAHPDELAALLSECHSAYFSARKSLLVSRLMEEIKGLDPSRTELVELTRVGCSYLKQLCTDEFNLYRSFFNSGKEQLYGYLENLCDYLYDDLRPRILHEPRLTALCEVCTVLQALMVLDLPAVPDSSSSSGGDEDEDDNVLALDWSASKNIGLGRLHISHLLQMVLQDAQTKLFFKAQSVIQAEVRYYVPKAEDLAYPDKLVEARRPTSGLEIKEKESVSQLFKLPSLDKQDTWFPTLRKTLWVLSQLHDFVKPAIFEDIAQEAVSLCRESLISAADLIKIRNPPSSIFDGDLFLVRHLLILKDMTQNLDLVQKDVEPVVDFGAVTETLATMLNKTTALLPGSLFASLGLPRGAEGINEVKHGIDHELQRACQAIISNCVDPICLPMHSWVARIHEHHAGRIAPPIPGEQPPPLTAQEWVQQPAAEELDSAFRLACERDLRAGAARLRLYLEDNRTVGVLLLHIKDRIVDEYGAFREVIWNMYAGALRGVVLTMEGLREILKVICDDDDYSASGS